MNVTEHNFVLLLRYQTSRCSPSQLQVQTTVRPWRSKNSTLLSSKAQIRPRSWPPPLHPHHRFILRPATSLRPEPVMPTGMKSLDFYFVFVFRELGTGESLFSSRSQCVKVRHIIDSRGTEIFENLPNTFLVGYVSIFMNHETINICAEKILRKLKQTLSKKQRPNLKNIRPGAVWENRQKRKMEYSGDISDFDFVETRQRNGVGRM